MMSIRKAGNRRKGRVLSAMLAVLFLAACMLGSAKEAEAATQYKYYYVPTQITVKTAYEGGGTNSYTQKFTYYTGARAGLLKQSAYLGGEKYVFSRTGAGLVNTIKIYDYDGSLSRRAKTTINKGKVKRIRYYDSADTLQQTYSIAYSGSRVTKMTMSANGMNMTRTYRSSGKLSKVVMQGGSGSMSMKQTYTCNAKGFPTKATMSQEWTGMRMKGTATIKYTLNKKGHPAKMQTTVITERTPDGAEPETRTNTETCTSKYTYKNGNITKIVRKVRPSDPGTPYTETVTVKYKKVKVAKKYWSMLDGKIPYVPAMYDSLNSILESHILPIGF